MILNDNFIKISMIKYYIRFINKKRQRSRIFGNINFE